MSFSVGRFIRRLLSAPPLLLDGSVGLALTAGSWLWTILEPERGMRPGDALALVLTAMVNLPLAFRRRAPCTVLATSTVTASVFHALGYHYGENTFASLLALYSVAAGDVLLAPTAIRCLIEAFRPPVPAVTAELAELTARETEVLTLIGRTLSNREIASRLSVTEATVKTHINRVMAKLGLRSRAQAVALAYDHGLVLPRRGQG
jgi:DNA-binding CsgD family transcriptional regulator